MLLISIAAACGGNTAATGTDGAGSGSDGSGSGSDGYTTLVSRPWMLSIGEQGYQCRHVQLTQDYWINSFRVIAPVGTHHTVVYIETATTQTGDFACSAGTGAFGGNSEMMYAAGVGTDDLTFPDGIAVHLKAGTWITLNLHLFDQQDNPLQGESGVAVKTIDPSTVVHEVDMTFSGTTNITVPNDGQTHTATGGCTVSQDTHVFALWPHMHQIGTHQTFAINGTAKLDTPYMFTEQKYYPNPEFVLHAGDRVDTTCSYVNPTTASGNVGFCDSSTCEMCFTGIYKYPAGGGEFGCVDQ